ncbi:hypothetical protein [Cytobacillus firmus]|uniref:hypothetical protein n=1 Tax=Cytobacillus firmus TaxID=1399 RepID=UPI002FFE1950
MSDYLSRKNKSRKLRFKKNKKLKLIINLWVCYLILLIFISIPDNTYSFFNDTEKFPNTLGISADFCADESYKKNHKDICEEEDKNNKDKNNKDNSGLGNGSEEGDHKDLNIGDEDNPGHQDTYCLEGDCIDHNNSNGSKKGNEGNNESNGKEGNGNESNGNNGNKNGSSGNDEKNENEHGNGNSEISGNNEKGNSNNSSSSGNNGSDGSNTSPLTETETNDQELEKQSKSLTSDLNNEDSASDDDGS